MLALVWIVSVAISSPIALGMNYTERRQTQQPTLCTFYNADFIIFSSMGSFYIPCLVMLLLYIRMFRTIRQRARLSVLRRASTRPDSGSPRRTWSDRKSGSEGKRHPGRDEGAGISCEGGALLSRVTRLRGEGDTWRISESLDETTDPLCERAGQHDDGSESATGLELMPLSPPIECRGTSPTCNDPSTLVPPPSECRRLSSVLAAPPGECSEDDRRKASLGYLRTARMSVTKLNWYLRQWPSQSRKDRSATRRERKATKTLAIVLGNRYIKHFPSFRLRCTQKERFLGMDLGDLIECGCSLAYLGFSSRLILGVEFRHHHLKCAYASVPPPSTHQIIGL